MSGYVLKKDWITDFNNKYTIIKDMSTSYAFVDGGGDAFGSWGYFKLSNITKTINTSIVFSTRNGADGVLYTETLTHNSCTWKIIHGWLTSGIFIIQVKQLTGTPTQFKLLWDGYYGTTGGYYTTVTQYTQPSSKYITTYSHNNNGVLDNIDVPQVNVTLIPYDNTLIETQQTLVTKTITTSREVVESIALSTGCTLIVNWGKAGIINVQNWINNMLEFDYIRKYLMNDGANGIKHWTGVLWDKIGDAPVTYEMFNTYGHDNIPTTSRTGLLLTNPNLLLWTDAPGGVNKQYKQKVIPTYKIVTQNNNYIISTGIKDITVKTNITGNSIFRFAVSIDSGTTWYYFAGTTWELININNAVSFETYGMTTDVLNAITQVQWTALTTGIIIRFAFYIRQDSVNDKCELDTLKIDWI